MIEERQVPRTGEVFLDHVGWYVGDMRSAASSFAKLGFPLTPYTEHRNTHADGTFAAAGTANRCAMVQRGYLELLTAVPGSDTPLAQQLREGLSRYAGVHLIALSTADAEAEHARLAEVGFDPRAVVRLRRPVVMTDGGQRTTAFGVIRVPPERMPEGRIQFVEHETPDLVWQPQWISRENAIDALTGILVIVADLAAAAERYARFSGQPIRTLSEGIVVIELDRGCIALADAKGRARQRVARPPPSMSSVALRSSNLAQTRAFLKGKGVRLTADERDHLVVDPQEAVGAELVIHAAGGERRLFAR